MDLPIQIENYMFNRQIAVLNVIEDKAFTVYRTNDAYPLYRLSNVNPDIFQHQIDGDWKDIKLKKKEIQERLF